LLLFSKVAIELSSNSKKYGGEVWVGVWVRVTVGVVVLVGVW